MTQKLIPPGHVAIGSVIHTEDITRKDGRNYVFPENVYIKATSEHEYVAKEFAWLAALLAALPTDIENNGPHGNQLSNWCARWVVLKREGQARRYKVLSVFRRDPFFLKSLIEREGIEL